MKNLSLSLILCLSLILGGCTTDQRLTTLEASIAASTVLFKTLQGSDPAHAAIYNDLVQATQNLPLAFEQTKEELATIDLDPIKYLKIAGYFSPTLTSISNLSPQAKVYADAVSQTILAFLAAINPPALGGNVSARRVGNEGVGVSYKLPAKVSKAIEKLSQLAPKPQGAPR